MSQVSKDECARKKDKQKESEHQLGKYGPQDFFLNTDGVCADERTVLRIRRMSGTTSLSIEEEGQVGAGGALIGRQEIRRRGRLAGQLHFIKISLHQNGVNPSD